MENNKNKPEIFREPFYGKFSRFFVITYIFLANLYYAGLFLTDNFYLMTHDQNDFWLAILGGALLGLSYKFSGFVILEFRNLFRK